MVLNTEIYGSRLLNWQNKLSDNQVLTQTELSTVLIKIEVILKP